MSLKVILKALSIYYQNYQGINLKMATDSANTMRADMHDKIKVIHNRVDEILGQVKLTNGRVSKLESWKNQMNGALKVLIIVSTALGFLFKMGWLKIG